MIPYKIKVHLPNKDTQLRVVKPVTLYNKSQEPYTAYAIIFQRKAYLIDAKSEEDFNDVKRVFQSKGEIPKKNVLLNLKAGLTEKDFVDCCYNCDFFRAGKSSTQGHCKKHNKRIMHYKTTVCPSHKYIELVECKQCGQFVRNLGLHAKSHRMTAAEYREKFGLNRTTVLAAEVTRKSQGKNSDISIANAHHPGIRNVNKGYKWREEGLENVRKDAISNELALTIKKIFDKYPKVKGVNLSPRCNAVIAQIMFKGKQMNKSFNIKKEGGLKKAYERAVKQRMMWEQELYNELMEEITK